MNPFFRHGLFDDLTPVIEELVSLKYDIEKAKIYYTKALGCNTTFANATHCSGT